MMRILIAEDDSTSRYILESILKKNEYDVISCTTGSEALEQMTRPGAPRLAIMDWMMPGMDGQTATRRIRETESESTSYIILLTAKSQKEDIVMGLESGADDYVTKPFSRPELLARVRVGERIITLNERLQKNIEELSKALNEVKILEGLIPMCANCKKVRDDEGYWEEVEGFLMSRSSATFSHGICPDCLAKLYPDYDRIKNNVKDN